VVDNSCLIMNLMRILTPEEIHDLTTKYCGEKRVSLTSLMVVRLKNFEKLAKIIPFNKNLSKPKNTSDLTNSNSDNIEKSELIVGEKVKELLCSLYGIKSNSMDSLFQTSSQEAIVEIKQKKSASIFILEQKEKLEINQRKLRGKEIIDTYKQVSGVDLDIERGHQDDLSWSSSHGLLVNKKQA
jgi:hypothetical protein